MTDGKGVGTSGTDGAPAVSRTAAVAAALRLVAAAAGRRATAVAVAFQVVGAVAAAGLVLGSTLALQALLAPSPSVSAAAGALVLLAAVSALSAATSAWQGQQQRLVAEQASAFAYDRLLAVTGRTDLQRVESPAFAERVDRIEEHALGQPAQIASAAFGLVGSVVSVVSVATAVASLQVLLLPLMVLPGLAALVLTRYAARSEFAFYTRYGELSRRRGYLRDLLVEQAYAKEVRSLDLAPELIRRHRALSAEFGTVLRRQVRLRQWLALGTAAVSAVALAATFVLIAALIASGRLGAAQAGAAVVATRLLAGQLDRLFASLGTIVEAAPFLADLEEFVRETPPAAATAGRPLRHGLAVRDLGYRYPTGDEDVLTGVDLDLGRGEIVALVGENGSGKSTLAKIVAGLYPPTTGQLVWDGDPLGPDDAATLRASVSCLFQDFVRYELTAAENVDLRAPSDPARRDRACRWLERVGLDGVVGALPLGADTVLGHRFSGAVDLSGGQWQRLALARALARPAGLVVLDEPSAALDVRAEHALFTRLRELLDGRAALLVSHRYTSLDLVDRIVVLQQGRVVENGSHATLLAAGGLYAELYRLAVAGRAQG